MNIKLLNFSTINFTSKRRYDNADIAQMAREGVTAKEMAEIKGTAVDNIYYRARSSNIILPKAKRLQKITEADVEDLKRASLNRVPIKEIAKQYDVNTDYIYKKFREFEIPLPESRKNPIHKELCQKAFELFDNGHEISEIAEIIKCPKSKVYNLIMEYTGKSVVQLKKMKVLDLLKSGMSDLEIAEKLKLQLKYISNMRDRLKRANNPKFLVKKEKAIQMLNKGFSIEQIAKELNVAVGTVYRYFKI